MNHLRRTAKALDILFLYTYRFTIALNILGGLLILFFLFLSLASPVLFDRITASLVTRLDFGGIAFQIADSFPSDPDAGKVFFFSSIIIGTLSLVLYGWTIRCIRSILAPMKEGLPFSHTAARAFRKLGWLTVANGLVNLAGDYFLNGTLVRAYDLQALFLSENIEKVTSFYNFDFAFIFAALVLFGFSYVFRYGEELQQLSDETL